MYSVPARAPLAAPLGLVQGQVSPAHMGPFGYDDVQGKMMVVVAYGIMIFVNFLAFSGGLGSSIGEISAEYPTYVTPDGLTFSIWGVIYLLQLALVIAQCMPSPDAEMLLRTPCCWPGGGPSVRYRIALAFILNAMWLPLFSAKMFELALIVIVAYLATLISIYIQVNAKTTTNVVQWFLYVAPIAANASWLLVATAASFFTVFGLYGWKDAYGVSGSVPAAVLVLTVAAAVASWLAVDFLDLAWSLVAAWALRGVYRAQTVPDDSFPTQAMSPALAEAANFMFIIVFLASLIGLALSLFKAYQANNRPVPFF